MGIVRRRAADHSRRQHRRRAGHRRQLAVTNHGAHDRRDGTRGGGAGCCRVLPRGRLPPDVCRSGALDHQHGFCPTRVGESCRRTPPGFQDPYMGDSVWRPCYGCAAPRLTCARHEHAHHQCRGGRLPRRLRSTPTSTVAARPTSIACMGRRTRQTPDATLSLKRRGYRPDCPGPSTQEHRSRCGLET